MTGIIPIDFSETIQSKIPGLRIGVLNCSRFEVRKESDYVAEQFTVLEQYIKEKFYENAPSTDSNVSAVRRMYRRIGWEPTQYRPSSEAMIRRFLKNKGLYRINNAVDLGNVASTRYHLPMGLYDRDKILGMILVDVGQDGETYRGISKDVIHADGKLVLRDKRGIFGNPTADSLRTSIGESSTNILALFFTPPEIDQLYISETLAYLRKLYKTECSESEIEFDVVSS
jgi:DNA/RNA-binding domain of Phe-tRNA-synthetase-like protein